MTHDEKMEALIMQQNALLAQHNALLHELIDSAKQQKPVRSSPDMVELPVRGKGNHIFPVGIIIMLLGMKQYTIVYIVKNNRVEKLELCHNLGHWENIFNEFGFLRVHRSRIINPSYIVDFSSTTHYLELQFRISFNVTSPYLEMLKIYFHKKISNTSTPASSNENTPSSNQNGAS